MKVILIAFVVLFMISPLLRVIVKNLHLVGIYSIVDVYTYFAYKKYDQFDCFGIDVFVGLFGRGKTLSMTHRANLLYKKFGDRIRFFSNYDLKNIPYTPLVNFQQLVDLGEDKTKYEGTVVCIDEIENVLNNRNFSKFPLALLHMINQQRKSHVYIMASSPRFFQIDKMLRIIATRIYNCNKFWRFQHIEVYDAWDYENAMNFRDIKRIGNMWWFVKNQDFNSYDTEQLISKDSAEMFISNEMALEKLGEVVQNSGAVVNRSKAVLKAERQKKKKKL